MAKILKILTEWVSNNGTNQMRAALDHPAAGVAYTDVTGQPDENIPTDPNLLLVEVSPVDSTLEAALKSDPNIAIVLEEDIVDAAQN